MHPGLAQSLDTVSNDMLSVTRKQVHAAAQHFSHGFEVGCIALVTILQRHLARPTDGILAECQHAFREQLQPLVKIVILPPPDCSELPEKWENALVHLAQLRGTTFFMPPMILFKMINNFASTAAVEMLNLNHIDVVLQAFEGLLGLLQRARGKIIDGYLEECVPLMKNWKATLARAIDLAHQHGMRDRARSDLEMASFQSRLIRLKDSLPLIEMRMSALVKQATTKVTNITDSTFPKLNLSLQGDSVMDDVSNDVIS